MRTCFAVLILSAAIMGSKSGAEPSSTMKKSSILVAEFFDVEIVLQGNRTARHHLYLTSMQAPDRIAASFCFRHRCSSSQSIQVEKVISNIQASNNSPVSKSVWTMNLSASFLPVFFHHTEGLTELQLFTWTEDEEAYEKSATELVHKRVDRFCARYNCSETAGCNGSKGGWEGGGGIISKRW
jgi:hypothetical protein